MFAWTCKQRWSHCETDNRAVLGAGNCFRRFGQHRLGKAMKGMKTSTIGAIAALLLSAAALQAQTSQLSFSKGDVFVATGDGRVQWRSPTGVLIKVLDTGIENRVFTSTGMAFDPCDNL